MSRYATFTLAVSRRRYYKEQQAWGDDFDGYFDVKAWRELGHHAVSSLRKGDRVVVVGHFVQSSWTPDGSSEKRWKTELTAEDVAPSLRWRGWRRGQREWPPQSAPAPGDEHMPARGELAPEEVERLESTERVMATAGIDGPI